MLLHPERVGSDVLKFHNDGPGAISRDGQNGWLVFLTEALPLADFAHKDPADRTIVSSALNGGADLLVTGDKEVLALKRVRSLQILTPHQFWDKEMGQPEHPQYGLRRP